MHCLAAISISYSTKCMFTTTDNSATTNVLFTPVCVMRAINFSDQLIK